MEGVTWLAWLHKSRLYKGQPIEVILNKNNLISDVFFIDFRSCHLLGNWEVFFECPCMRTRSISPRVPLCESAHAQDLGLCMCSWSMGHVTK